MTIRTLALASATTSIQDHRLALGAFMGPGSSALERRSGVYYYPGAADLVSASSLQANVTPFVAVVDGTSNALQGQVVVVVDANETLTFSAGEVAVARTDRVVLQVRDNTFDASGSTDARVVIIKGNTSTGAANSVPASSLWLWDVVVPIGASSITFSSARVDRRQWTATPLRIPVTSSTQRDALPTIAGLEVTRLDTGNIEQYWSGAWRTIAPAATPTRFLVANQAARDALTPTTGLEVTRLDTGDVEQYWSGAWRIISPAAAPTSQVLFARKTSNTSRTSATATADPHLSVAVEANSVYAFDSFLHYTADAAGDLKYRLEVPAGSTANIVINSIEDDTTGVEGPINRNVMPLGEFVLGAAAGAGSSQMGAMPKGILITGGTAGTCVLYWGQRATHATGTVLFSGSYMRLEKVA